MPNRRSSPWIKFNILNEVSPTFSNTPEKTLYIGQRLEFPYASFFTQGSPPATLSIGLAKNISGDAIDITALAGISSSIIGPNAVVDASSVVVNPQATPLVQDIYYQITATVAGKTPVKTPWTVITTRQPVAAVIGPTSVIQLVENHTVQHMIASVVTLGDPPLRPSDFISVLLAGDATGTDAIHTELSDVTARVAEVNNELTLILEATGVDVSENRMGWLRIRANQRTAAEAQTALNG